MLLDGWGFGSSRWSWSKRVLELQLVLLVLQILLPVGFCRALTPLDCKTARMLLAVSSLYPAISVFFRGHNVLHRPASQPGLPGQFSPWRQQYKVHIVVPDAFNELAALRLMLCGSGAATRCVRLHFTPSNRLCLAYRPALSSGTMDTRLVDVQTAPQICQVRDRNSVACAC